MAGISEPNSKAERLHIELMEQYDRVQGQRMDAMMLTETYEQFLERLISEGRARFANLEEQVACFLDADQNQTAYNAAGNDSGTTILERQRQNLIFAMSNYGWDCAYNELTGYVEVQSPYTGRYVTAGLIRREQPKEPPKDTFRPNRPDFLDRKG